MRFFIIAAALLTGCAVHKAPVLDPLSDEPVVERAPPTAPADAARQRLPQDLEDEAATLSHKRVADRLARTPTPRAPTGGGHAPAN